jgi:hypothetical protein
MSQLEALGTILVEKNKKLYLVKVDPLLDFVLLVGSKVFKDSVAFE